MLTLWYIILGWKEYNKPLKKAEQPPKSVEPAKKPDLIPLKKDAPPTKPSDISTPQPTPIAIPKPPTPRTPELPPFNDKPTGAPKIPEPKTNLPTPRTPELPSFNDKPTGAPKIPEPKTTFPTPKTPEPPKTPPASKLPEPFKPPPRTPEPPKPAQPPTPPPRTPETPKLSDFRLAPEPPNKPDTPKTPDTLPKTIPSRSLDSKMPDIPFSGKNPAYVPPPNQSEFPLPPYLPGAPQNKPASRDDELFAMANAFPSPTPDRPLTDLRDLSYAKGEFPGEEVGAKVKDTLTRIPKYMEQSVISNPDSLESDEEDEDF